MRETGHTNTRSNAMNGQRHWKLTFYVPVSRNSVGQRILDSCFKSYGGATTTYGFGSWADDAGNIVGEAVQIITTYADDLGALEHSAKLFETWAKQAGEIAVCYEVASVRGFIG